MSDIESFALIVGAMKSGTTSLFNYLAEHPEIAPSNPKEPHFFTDAEKWSQGWSWYQSLWDWQPDRHRIAMEASTSYTKLPRFPNAAERIAQISSSGRGRFKFIYIMRNPIERIESHYTHGKAADWDTTKVPLEQGMVHQQLIEVSNYAKQIDEYYKRFPEQDIKLLIFEEMKSDPLVTLQEICVFLGVDLGYEFKGLGKTHNTNRHRITNRTIMRLKQTSAVRTVSSILPRMVKDNVMAVLGHKQKNNIRLSSSQRERVLAALKPDLRRLERVYGVNLSLWDIST